MCDPGGSAQPAPVPAPASGQPWVAAQAALATLTGPGAGAFTTAQLADALRGLEHVESALVAARSAVLARFEAHRGYEDDGHGSARSWLIWQTSVTSGAAASAIGWMRRLAAHPHVDDVLSAGEVSPSWARAICDWTGLLPEEARADADVILLGAAAGGARLEDIAGLAEELHKRTVPPDADGCDGGFADRSVRLDIHYQGAGKLDGDLTPRCATALAAVLDALAKKVGPEDTRTKAQRRHDALEEACRRLIAAGNLPDRAGQPTQIQLIMTLDQLARGAGPGPLAGPGDDCDATIVPVVTGHVDHDLLDRLASLMLGAGSPCPGGPFRASSPDDAGRVGGKDGNAAGRSHGCQAGRDRGNPAGVHGNQPAGDHGSQAGEAGPIAARAARELTLSQAVALLSGPTGLAAYLRRHTATGPAASASLPLDVGTATETIPPHLRRAVAHRDRHCSFAGCYQPPAACQVHHVIPRSQGGATELGNLVLSCSFHHLIVIHQWGWMLRLNADGTTTAVSPDGRRTLHSHSPPTRAA